MILAIKVIGHLYLVGGGQFFSRCTAGHFSLEPPGSTSGLRRAGRSASSLTPGLGNLVTRRLGRVDKA